MLTRRLLISACCAAVAALVATAPAAQAQTTPCVIASKDGRNTYRTDEITQCRINTANGEVSFVLGGRERQRSYDGREPLTTQHLDMAAYWLARAGQLRVPASSNPAGFDLEDFLRAASQATHGFVLVRNRRSGQALNVVYITDGVYRSIDFSSRNMRERPSGFLITE